MKKAVFGGAMFVLWLGPAAWLPVAGAAATEKSAARLFTVSVDPRVELMSILFRLAGNREYNQGRVPSYVQDVESHFGRFRDHPAVKLAQELRQTRGISFNAPMGLAVHVTDAGSLQEKVPLSPLPDSMDSRWTPGAAREFLALARTFVAETDFKGFLDEHEPLYRLAVQRMQETLDKQGHLEWFDSFFGPRKGADFHVILGMLNGGPSYGARLKRPGGQEDLYSIIGVWMVDAQGQPGFPAEVVPTVVHEFTHSYTNALVDQFAKELKGPGEKIFPFVAAEMRRQAYPDWKTMMYESLDRACGLRYVLATDGPAAMRKAVAYENSRSFYWVGELAEVLGEYDTQPKKYSDLAQFFPRIIAFFNDYAKDADTKLGAVIKEKKEKQERQFQEWQEKGPKIVALTPANGAQDVDPNLKAIVVTFDRPMRDKSWAVVTFVRDQFPKISGPVGYDAARQVFTAPVQLQPGKEYLFGLNAEKFLGFCSEGGIPLAPVVVRFKTKQRER
jgi:hypothetical protein